jgi:hypothetical protein
MRVQNEGTGKSSWWMLNPDAKPGKSVRRRAASMETSKFEKRRGRVKKRVEQIRNGVITSKQKPAKICLEAVFIVLLFNFRCDWRAKRSQLVAWQQR